MKQTISILTFVALLLGAIPGHSAAQTQSVTKDSATMHANLIKAFAPTGVLRASLNVGNPVLANLDAQGKPF